MAVRNTCSYACIDAAFRPLTQAAIRVYRDLFGDSLISVRLVGSVARADAIPCHSDLDLLALLQRQPDLRDAQRLGAQAVCLRLAYPVVSAVDLDVAWSEKLSAFQRFVLSSDSVSVFGDDGLTVPVQYVDRDVLVALVTPHGSELIADYRRSLARLAPGRDDAAIARYARTISKDLLRCLRSAALSRGAPYVSSLEAIHAGIAQYLPDCRALAAALLDTYRHGPRSKRALLTLIDEASRHLDQL